MKTDADNIAATPRPPGAQLQYPLWMDPARERLPESRRSAGMMGRAPESSRGDGSPWLCLAGGPGDVCGARLGVGSGGLGCAKRSIPHPCGCRRGCGTGGSAPAGPPAPAAPPAPRPLLVSPGLAAGGRGSPWGELMRFEGKRSRRRGRSRRGGGGTAQHSGPRSRPSERGEHPEGCSRGAPGIQGRRGDRLVPCGGAGGCRGRWVLSPLHHG